MAEKKTKFTVIDAIIILVVLAAVAAGAKKLIPKVLNSGGTEKVQFTVLLQREDPGFAEAVEIGDNVTVSLTEKDGGVVTDVKAEPAKTLAFNGIDGTYSNEVIEGKEDVYVTIEADASVSELALKTGGTLIKVGAEVPVRGKGYASMGYIIDIQD